MYGKIVMKCELLEPEIRVRDIANDLQLPSHGIRRWWRVVSVHL